MLEKFCVNGYKILTKIIEIVTKVRLGLQKPPLDVTKSCVWSRRDGLKLMMVEIEERGKHWS